MAAWLVVVVVVDSLVKVEKVVGMSCVADVDSKDVPMASALDSNDSVGVAVPVETVAAVVVVMVYGAEVSSTVE